MAGRISRRAKVRRAIRRAEIGGRCSKQERHDSRRLLREHGHGLLRTPLLIFAPKRRMSMPPQPRKPAARQAHKKAPLGTAGLGHEGLGGLKKRLGLATSPS